MTVKQIEDAHDLYSKIQDYKERIFELDQVGASFPKMRSLGWYRSEDYKAVDEIYQVHQAFYHAELRLFYETRMKEAEELLAAI